MGQKAAYDMVIHGGIVLTANDRFDVYDSGQIGIKEGAIAHIAASNANTPLPPAKHVIDASHCIVAPGLVNTHTHASMALFRGLADDVPLMTWLYDYMFKAEKRWLNPETVYHATCLACAEMLLSGTTMFCDGYFFEDTVAEAVEKAGLRAILGQGIVDFPAPGVPDPAKNVDHGKRFVEKWLGKSPLIRPSLFCHSPYTCSDTTLKAARKAADDTGSLFQIHVAETKAEWTQIREKHGLSPVQYLDSLGILNENTLAVHVIWVDDEDRDILARRKTGLSITTESEMKLASGVAPVPAFLEKGIPVGMGTDGCASNNNLDLFDEMDFMAKLHKVNTGDPEALSARQVFSIATRSGAQVVGLGKKIGTLEKGKRADIIIIDMDKPHLVPMYDPVSHLVYCANGGDVRDVIVDGRPIVKNRQCLTLDVEEVMMRLKQMSRKIAASL